jgi:hypothetical protein
MARMGEAVVVGESGEGVRFRRRDDEISFADDDEIEAAWTRPVAAREPRCSKTRNDARACVRNIIRVEQVL